MNPKTLVSIHCYQGDRKQIDILRPHYEHHGLPVIVVSPDDAPVNSYGPHWCVTAGKAGYTGPHTWIRQHLQMKKLLELDFDYYFMNDSDSFCLDAKLPDYLFAPENENVIFSNLVDDFRIPGQTTHGHYWPESYHKGYPIKASQPSYMCSRKALEKICSVDPYCDDEITPFIDFFMIKAPVDAGVELRPFHACASCETETPNGMETMARCVREGAVFIHAIKNQGALDLMVRIYNKRNGLK